VVQGRRQVWGTPKSYEQREVPIPRFLINDLAEHVRDKSRDDLVFTGVRSGTALRAASLAIASGANVKVVQQMLGHKSATVTLDQYGHLFGDDLDTIADRLDVQARTARGLLADYLRTAAGPEATAQ
jgi:integrase